MGQSVIGNIIFHTHTFIIKSKWSHALFSFLSYWFLPALPCREYYDHWYFTKIPHIFRYPSHASCEVKWTIPTSCEEFKTKIINQMRAWEVTFRLTMMTVQRNKKYVIWEFLLLFFLLNLNCNFLKREMNFVLQWVRTAPVYLVVRGASITSLPTRTWPLLELIRPQNTGETYTTADIYKSFKIC